MLAWLDALARQAGPAALAALFLGAALEYLFPPFPGDTVTVLGGLIAVRGGASAPLVFAAVMLGSLSGAALDYLAGRWLARQLDSLPSGGGVWRYLPREKIRNLEAQFRRRGAIWLLLNRFLPAVRGPIFLAAGIARLNPWSVFLWGGVSALAWNGLLFAAGWAVGGRAERLEALLRGYSRVAWAALAAAAALLVCRSILRHLKALRGRHSRTD
jgi:membrane protein DedA with SNARE-associated domain